MEAFEGGREEGTLTAFVQLFRPTLGQDEGEEQQEPQNERVRSDFLQACYFRVRPWTRCVSITHRHPLFIYASKIQ